MYGCKNKISTCFFCPKKDFWNLRIAHTCRENVELVRIGHFKTQPLNSDESDKGVQEKKLALPLVLATASSIMSALFQDIDWVQTEKHVFEQASSNPFLVGLHSCFQTTSR